MSNKSYTHLSKNQKRTTNITKATILQALLIVYMKNHKLIVYFLTLLYYNKINIYNLILIYCAYNFIFIPIIIN